MSAETNDRLRIFVCLTINCSHVPKPLCDVFLLPKSLFCWDDW